MAQTLSQKLRALPGTRVAVLGAPDGFPERLGADSGLSIDVRPEGRYDVVQIFVRTQDELRASLSKGAALLDDAGILWIAYPKRSSSVESDLSRDVLHASMKEAGFGGVALVAIDETWSAMRFKRG